LSHRGGVAPLRRASWWLLPSTAAVALAVALVIGPLRPGAAAPATLPRSIALSTSNPVERAHQPPRPRATTPAVARRSAPALVVVPTHAVLASPVRAHGTQQVAAVSPSSTPPTTVVATTTSTTTTTTVGTTTTTRGEGDGGGDGSGGGSGSADH